MASSAESVRALDRPTHAALRVPQITLFFWIIKGLSAATGEATSDYLVRTLHPVPAVLVGFVGFVVALVLQLSQHRYRATTYWFAVVMVGVFGTMGADVMHVGLGVPYPASTVLCAVVLAAVFVTWYRVEDTLSIHSIDTQRKELFYWAAVIATFAFGTAAGDLLAVSLHLGYSLSILIFGVMILAPIIGFRLFRLNPIVAFWSAYVLTRPIGATVADWSIKSKTAGGLAWPEGPLCLALTLVIAVLVIYLEITRRDQQPRSAAH
ncbi:MAG: putative rane-anchored protein [Ilumatobacteraceae bacterium]|nr:putative rane-anchored protein [Ilumatobacteraceae bacterium]